MKKIPLHSLILTVGPTLGGKSQIVNNNFESFEIVSEDDIKFNLVGDTTRRDVNHIVFDEILRRTSVKLNLGERVVVDAANLVKEERVAVASLGQKLNVPVFYIVCNNPLEQKVKANKKNSFIIEKQEKLFLETEKDLVWGDGIAEIIDSRNESFQVINRLPRINLINDLRNKGFKGITVIADVHGMLESMRNAIEWARTSNHFIVFLGDVLDYGPKSLECVELAYEYVVRGLAAYVIGNHERKINRWLPNRDTKVNFTEGNLITSQALENRPEDAKQAWIAKFKAVMNLAANHWIIGNTLFTHAAADPIMFSISDKNLWGRLERLALIGEYDPQDEKASKPEPTYRWVEKIPNDQVVIVGHDIRSTVKPVEMTSLYGGSAIFLDTGSGKGGSLTTADLVFQGNKLKLTNYNRH